MAKKWTKTEIRKLEFSYERARSLGMRVVVFSDMLEGRSRSQCLNQARRLGIQRKKNKGFGLEWQRKLNEGDKNYIAGILDGEGYISTNNSNYLVGVAMTDEKLMRWLHQKLGGSFALRKRRKGKIGWNKQEYAWKINGMVQVKSFLQAMISYLRVKHNNALMVIEKIEKKQRSL